MVGDKSDHNMITITMISKLNIFLFYYGPFSWMYDPFLLMMEKIMVTP